MIDSTKALYRALVIGSVILLVDQATKKLAGLYGMVLLNTGISFGLLPADHPVLSFLLMVGLAMLIMTLIQQHWHKHPISTGLFMGGAISNLIDRLVHGGVKDWLPVGPLPLKNNLADWAIFAAVILVFLTIWKEDNETLRQRKPKRRVQ